MPLHVSAGKYKMRGNQSPYPRFPNPRRDLTRLKVVAAEKSMSRSLSPATPTRDVQDPSGDGVTGLGPWAMRGVPRLRVDRSSRASKRTVRESPTMPRFRYRARGHLDLPHVVKFSGGRSSGMLLFLLLENGLLQRERGDVVVFNNTSCEHPETYRFAARCKEIVETHYRIPFFWIEFQTYEDVGTGAGGSFWTRLSTYRLVNGAPQSDKNPAGYRSQGEAFEELVSHSGFVPNQFRRICTKSLKLETTRAFLSDYLACQPTIPRLGHYGTESRIDLAKLHKRHELNGGGVPMEVYREKKKFVLSQPHIRPQQRYVDFSPAASDITNPVLEKHVYGDKARLATDGLEYIALVGIRTDEQTRVARIEARSDRLHAAPGYEGEHVYMPLDTMHVTRGDVANFWAAQSWDLGLPADTALSNCVYCFLKGSANLGRVQGAMDEAMSANTAGVGKIVDTPCDVNWWARMERVYGRDLEREGRPSTRQGNGGVPGFIGFFGANSKWSYEALSAGVGAEALARISSHSHR